MELLGERYGAVSMSKIEVPVKPITETNIQNVHLPMLAQHCTLEYLYQKEPETFKKRICPPTDALGHLGNEMEHHPQMVGHPVKLRRDYKHRAIPLSLHGDGAPALKQNANGGFVPSRVSSGWSMQHQLAVVGEPQTRRYDNCSLVGSWL